MEAACNKEGVYSSPLPPRASSRQELVKVAVHLKAMAAASPYKTTHMYGVLLLMKWGLICDGDRS